MIKEKAMRMLVYSAAAYNDVQPLFESDIMHTIDDAQSGVQCYVRINGTRAYITFRGTNAAVDRYKNIMFCKKCGAFDEDGVCVHRGFLSAYKSENVCKSIREIIRNGINEVNITGHSLGAAIATICAYDLYNAYPDKAYEVYLFGSPRVGNRKFALSYNKKLVCTFRFENGNDIVCKVPPAWLGYRHVGALVRIGRKKSIWKVSFLSHYPHDYLEKIYSSMFLHNS